ncbi:MAG TPA: amylo-alpha-1,6-glucosidase [Bryobacteraceae bacterium]|nr:amylo-alpha-1,6-glucosidase [Bryobacteraceae bacterium]
MICFDQTVCEDLERARKLEWLETNGLGGFSSSTIVGLNTRRYHGLLTAATKPPVGRMVLLSKMEETLRIDGRHYDFSANQYPGAIFPEGHRYLAGFRLDPFPKFIYRLEGIEIEKRVFMVHGENTVVIEYEIRSRERAPDCSLELRPLIAFRDYHATTHHNDSLNRGVQTAGSIASVTPYEGLPTLYFGHNAYALEEGNGWYFNFEYAAELERGLDGHEDLFNPMVLRFSFRDHATATVIASTRIHAAAEAPVLRELEVRRREAVIQRAASPHPMVRQLTAAADHFLVQRGAWNSVIAGYHWFADWGRDTMIALPGLTLMTGRPEIARNILEAFTASAREGMLPNRFPDAGELPEYNTVDATLWLFEAVRSYIRYTGDHAFVRERLYAKLKEIVDWHLRGTRYGIHVDADGLLTCGEPGVQLTWMDAKVGDWVVTPRTGKPVEIQALWYNALQVLRDLAHQFGDAGPETFFRELAERARHSFHGQFWNADAGCLYDGIDGEHRDASIRPNQIFAVSLRHRMLPPEKERRLVDVVQHELLTPLGLRSLSPHDANYRPHYEGGVHERDSAYHQGTVWPWLIGPFLSAYVKVHGRSGEARQQAAVWVEGFHRHLSTAGLGQISEIADAEPPHKARGCIAQAWSVAELLRAAIEDVYEIPLWRP